MTEKMKTEVEKLQAQVKEAEGIIKKSVAYIAQTQPELDKQADFEDRFMKRASEIAGVLADRGIISQAETTKLVAKLAEDKVRALDLVGRLARLVGPDNLGKQAADVKVAAGEEMDPFVRLVLFGDSTKTKGEDSLMVD